MKDLIPAYIIQRRNNPYKCLYIPKTAAIIYREGKLVEISEEEKDLKEINKRLIENKLGEEVIVHFHTIKHILDLSRKARKCQARLENRVARLIELVEQEEKTGERITEVLNSLSDEEITKLVG